jgi:hypothetical protein
LSAPHVRVTAIVAPVPVWRCAGPGYGRIPTCSAALVHHPRRAHQGPDPGIVADGNDLSVANGHRTGLAVLCIDHMDATMQEHEVGRRWCFLTHAAGAGRGDDGAPDAGDDHPKIQGIPRMP